MTMTSPPSIGYRELPEGLAIFGEFLGSCASAFEVAIEMADLNERSKRANEAKSRKAPYAGKKKTEAALKRATELTRLSKTCLPAESNRDFGTVFRTKAGRPSYWKRGNCSDSSHSHKLVLICGSDSVPKQAYTRSV